MSARAQRSDEPDSVSQHIAPEWLQPNLCVRSDLTEDPSWLESSDSTGPSPAAEWLQPNLCVRSDSTEEPAWLEYPDSTGLSPASVWASDYDDEVTLQSKRVAAKGLEQVTEDRDDESTAINASRRVCRLDESQVLADEASFATVTVNEPIEQAVVKWREQAETGVGESSLIDTRSAVRLLDESQILPGEVSFATAMSNEPLRMSTYSPLSEFLVKTRLNLTQLMLAFLLLVSVIAVTTFLFLRLTTEKAGLNSPSTVNRETQTSPVEADPTAETKAVTTFDSSEPVAVSKSQEQLRGAAASTREEDLKLKGASETGRRTSSENLSSEAARQVPFKQPESGRSVKTSPQNAKSILSRSALADDSSRYATIAPKRLRASVKETVIARRAAASKRSDVKDSRYETVVGRREIPSSTKEAAAAAERPKDEPKIPLVTGGGERPRKVTP